MLWLSLPRGSCSLGFQEVREVQIVGDTERHSASAGVQAHSFICEINIFSPDTVIQDKRGVN